VPVTEPMPAEDIAGEYELNTGMAIVRAFNGKDPDARPGVLVANHGPFAWGKDAAAAAHNAVVLESLARMAFLTITLNHEAEAISGALHDKHYLRKHGSDAYYGQTKEAK
jgi:L-ribulose-5-phosphate 4-epimerase